MKKRILNLGLLALFLMSLLSCSSHDESLPVRQLKPERAIHQLSDSSFFSDIRSIVYYKDRYFLTDYERDNIFILNKNLELEKTLGRKGKGPGELLGSSQLGLYHDSIFVSNDYKRTIEVFNDTIHLQTLHIPKSLYMKLGLRLGMKDEKIFVSSYNGRNCISGISLHSDSILSFGDLKPYRTPRETRIKNGRHIQVMGNRIVAVSVCRPEMEIYNLSGVKVGAYNYGEIPLVRAFMQYVDRQPKEEDSYDRLASDIYASGNKIFILTLSIGKEGNRHCNTIIEFELADDHIVPVQILDLGNGWFGPICVSNDKVLAYDQRVATLTLYDIPESVETHEMASNNLSEE